MLAQAPDLLSALKKDRSALWRSDALRSIGFILVTADLMVLPEGNLKAT
jgi:hypothetical protein